MSKSPDLSSHCYPSVSHLFEKWHASKQDNFTFVLILQIPLRIEVLRITSGLNIIKYPLRNDLSQCPRTHNIIYPSSQISGQNSQASK